MVYYGTFKNGKLVLDGHAAIPDGTRVRIELDSPKGSSVLVSGAALQKFAGVWKDQAAEMEQSLHTLRQMKDAEIKRQASEPEIEL